MIRIRFVVAALLVLSVQLGFLEASDLATVSPTKSGILHLGGDWQWSKWGEFPVVEGTLAIDRLPRVKLNDMRVEDHAVWKTFSLPPDWVGRKIFLTYDVVGLESSGITGIWLNGKKVPITLPKRKMGMGTFPQKMPCQDSFGMTWFREVSSLLHEGKTNTIKLRVARWPMQSNMGVWLFCPPQKEKVLFLQSANLQPLERSLVTRYIRHVKKHFDVEPLQQTRSFETSAALREHLIATHEKEGISGVVLIGEHPLVTQQKGEPKAVVRYYESLNLSADAVSTFGDRHRKMDIWTAWIRKVPGHESRFATYLAKINSYYERRLAFPDKLALLPDPCGNPFGGKNPVENGVDHYDLLCRSADLTYFNAHAGTSHGGNGPHNSVSVEESLEIYPAGLVIRLYGCSAGNIARPDMTPGESFLFGKAVTQAVMTHTKPQGGAFKSMPWYMFEDLLKVCPNLGTAYQFLYDFRGRYPYSLVLLGNPFVKIGEGYSAPSGSIQGTVKSSHVPTLQGMYVSVHKGDRLVTRVKTFPNTPYAMECLPLGVYTVMLHLNALESLQKKTRVRAGQGVVLDWELPSLWRVEGRLLSVDGKPVANSWVEIADTPTKEKFRANDLFPIYVDEKGDFTIVGDKKRTFWIRGCVGKRKASLPVRVDVQPRGHVSGVMLRLKR